jgi:RNA polymerase-interacting CarD/CdnL/TRCF family regulator
MNNRMTQELERYSRQVDAELKSKQTLEDTITQLKKELSAAKASQQQSADVLTCVQNSKFLFICNCICVIL